MEKFAKEQKKKEKDRMQLQLQKDSHRNFILQAYKNKMNDFDEKSNSEYRSYIKTAKSYNLKSMKSMYYAI